MTSPHDTFMRKVHENLGARTAAVEPLAAVLAERQRLVALLSATDEPYSKAYGQAVDGGWSPDELAKLGAVEPARRPRGRPRSAASRRPAGALPGQAAPAGGPAASGNQLSE
ncbi:hypothetical protein ACFVFS_08500 [Kitasatospora sp. NPDC057692]|uniref:hypothetical protein n=1 Tax=Kitasatospora sp. NPDC057692 TaxID=3346215 RepID=UPI0036A870E1